VSESPSRSTWLAALVTAALVAAVVALGAAPARAQPRHAVVIADSILLGAQHQLVGRLQGAGWTVDFDGAVSRSTSAGAEAVRARAGSLVDTLVISLGANDSGNPATFRQRVDAVMAAAGGVPRVYWLTIREVRPYYGPANQVLREAAARYPNLQLIDWHAASAGRSDLTASDGLHLKPSGAEALADLIASTVLSGAPVAATPPAAPPPPPTSVVVDTTAPPPDAAPTEPAPPPAQATSDPAGSPDATTTTAVLDRSRFVAEDVSAPATRATASPSSGRGGPPWGWLLLLALAVAATAVVFQRLGVLTVSGRAPRAPVTRSQLRAARIANARERHPAVGAGASPPDPDQGTTPSDLSGTGAGDRRS
jgi:hypothetical protein